MRQPLKPLRHMPAEQRRQIRRKHPFALAGKDAAEAALYRKVNKTKPPNLSSAAFGIKADGQ